MINSSRMCSMQLLARMAAVLVALVFVTPLQVAVAQDCSCRVTVREVGAYVDGDRILVDWEADLQPQGGQRWRYSFVSRVRYRVVDEDELRESVIPFTTSTPVPGPANHTARHLCSPLRDCEEVISVGAEQITCACIQVRE